MAEGPCLTDSGEWRHASRFAKKWHDEKWRPMPKMEGHPCQKMEGNPYLKWMKCRKMEDSRERIHASCVTYSGEWLQASRSAEIADSRERLHASRSQIAEKGSKPVASQIAGKGIKPPAVHDKILSVSSSHSGKLQRETLTKLNITYRIFKQDTMPAHEARQMAEVFSGLVPFKGNGKYAAGLILRDENNTRLQPPKPGVSGMVAHATFHGGVQYVTEEDWILLPVCYLPRHSRITQI